MNPLTRLLVVAGIAAVAGALLFTFMSKPPAARHTENTKPSASGAGETTIAPGATAAPRAIEAPSRDAAASETAPPEGEPTTGTFLVGRLLDVAGAPLANGVVELGLLATGNSTEMSGSDTARTDASGRFRVRWPFGAEFDRSARVDFVFEGESDLRCEAASDLPMPLAPGEIDLGDIRLSASPLIAAGQVVDSLGAGREAHVWIERLTGNGEWDTVIELGGATDPQGFFRLRRALPAELGESPRLRASAQDEDNVESPRIEFALGAEGLKLVIPARGGVAGHVRRPDGAVEIDVALVRGEQSLRYALPENGDFEIPDADAGAWEFQVIGRLCGPIVRIPDVVVAAGDVARDPRLADVTLDGVAKVLSIEVVDPQGAVIPTANVRRTGNDRATAHLAPDATALRILAPLAGLDLEIAAKGFRGETAKAVAADRRFVLWRETP